MKRKVSAGILIGVTLGLIYVVLFQPGFTSRLKHRISVGINTTERNNKSVDLVGHIYGIDVSHLIYTANSFYNKYLSDKYKIVSLFHWSLWRKYCSPDFLSNGIDQACFSADCMLRKQQLTDWFIQAQINTVFKQQLFIFKDIKGWPGCGYCSLIHHGYSAAAGNHWQERLRNDDGC